jgi:hypothetical protein
LFRRVVGDLVVLGDVDAAALHADRAEVLEARAHGRQIAPELRAEDAARERVVRMRVHVVDAPVFTDLVDERDVAVHVIYRGAGADGTRLNLHRIEIGDRVLVHVGADAVGGRRHGILDVVDDRAAAFAAGDVCATSDAIALVRKADVAAAARGDAVHERERQLVLPRIVGTQHVDEVGAVGVERDAAPIGAAIRIGVGVDAVVRRLAAAFADTLDEGGVAALILFAPLGFGDAPSLACPRGARPKHDNQSKN